MAAATAPLTGKHTTQGRPHSRTSLTPHIAVTPAEEALVFYRDAFGAVIADVTRFGGVVAHADMEFDSGAMTVSDPMEAYNLAAPTTEGKPVTYSLALYLPDIDAAVGRAVALGATLLEPPATFVSGDRFASVLDPFGVRWSLMTRVEDLSPAESRSRLAEWAAAQG